MLYQKKNKYKKTWKPFIFLILMSPIMLGFNNDQPNFYKDKDYQSLNYLTYTITPSTTKNELEEIVRKAKKEVKVILELKAIAYNKENKISKIHIDYTDPNGQQGTFTDIDNDTPIHKITIAIELDSENKFKEISFIDVEYFRFEDVIQKKFVKK
ncbi:hypothetical protein [Aquimarina sp. MMG016]|uniref:hypothetical protein n=1 Tax=Aquimarina sp. MMG016 TaxID=2822690 RepID=UPI001B3A0BBC|nr:hypothetical protein [Aquimarina sp. MMG016]MBQ4820518.1 hypothetical protein [Aquimarina sp. MMG016]